MSETGRNKGTPTSTVLYRYVLHIRILVKATKKIDDEVEYEKKGHLLG